MSYNRYITLVKLIISNILHIERFPKLYRDVSTLSMKNCKPLSTLGSFHRMNEQLLFIESIKGKAQLQKSKNSIFEFSHKHQVHNVENVFIQSYDIQHYIPQVGIARQLYQAPLFTRGRHSLYNFMLDIIYCLDTCVYLHSFTKTVWVT